MQESSVYVEPYLYIIYLVGGYSGKAADKALHIKFYQIKCKDALAVMFVYSNNNYIQYICDCKLSGSPFAATCQGGDGHRHHQTHEHHNPWTQTATRPVECETKQNDCHT